MRKRALTSVWIVSLGMCWAHAPAFAETILFVGNSFTYGALSAVHEYRPETVTDLNHEGVGGVPALFESFTRQAGLRYEVSLELTGGVNLDFHFEHKSELIARAWDHVVLQGYSTLDESAPGSGLRERTGADQRDAQARDARVPF